MPEVQCYACGKPADGTFGPGGPPCCIECYRGKMQERLDESIRKWQLLTGKGSGHGKYIKPT